MKKAVILVNLFLYIYSMIKRIVRKRGIKRTYHFLPNKSVPMQEKETNTDDTPIIIQMFSPKKSANFSFKSFSAVSPFM